MTKILLLGPLVSSVFIANLAFANPNIINAVEYVAATEVAIKSCQVIDPAPKHPYTQLRTVVNEALEKHNYNDVLNYPDFNYEVEVSVRSLSELEPEQKLAFCKSMQQLMERPLSGIVIPDQ